MYIDLVWHVYFWKKKKSAYCSYLLKNQMIELLLDIKKLNETLLTLTKVMIMDFWFIKVLYYIYIQPKEHI